MRNLLFPVAVLVLAAGVLFAGLGSSLASTEIPDQTTALTTTTVVTQDDTATGVWIETDRKPPQTPKSVKQQPNEPYPPGSRRPRP
jgi:hypothetical protein